MNTIFNTLAYANRLKNAGVDAQQAEAQAEAMLEAMSHMSDDYDRLVTKEEFKTTIDRLVTKEEFKNELHELRGEIKTLETKLTLRMGAMFAATITLLSALLLMLHPH